MTKFTYVILVLFFFAGCRAKENPAPKVTPKAKPVSPVSQSASSAKTRPRVTASPNSKSDAEEHEYWTTTAVYNSCTVYAGATDFHFRSQDGESLQFRNSNRPDEEKAVKVSVDLIDPAANEGPPGANPAWVGRTFLLTLNEKDEVIAAEPFEESLGESDPVSATKSVDAGREVEATSNLPVILAIPEGFTSSSFGGQEGTTVMLDGASGDVHIFIPDPTISGTGRDSVMGEDGIFDSNGWSPMESERQSQPSIGWATDTFPFYGPGGLEGVVWLGNFSGKEVQVTASATEAQIDEFYRAIGPMLQSMQLRE